MPGCTLGSNSRAASTAIAIRPSGVTNATNAIATSHQLTADGLHGYQVNARATSVAQRQPCTHCSAANVANGTDSTICASCVG